MEYIVGHGHVVPRPDGQKMRCGGPAVCTNCAREKAYHDAKNDAVSIPKSVLAQVIRLITQVVEGRVWDEDECRQVVASLQSARNQKG